jgi:glutathione synthase/RimK-type ligase-like ATP-grasp enzyme
MTSKLWVYSGNRPSNSAKDLAAMPGFLRLRLERFFKVKPTSTVINWGCSTPFNVGGQVINKPEAISTSTDKLQAFYAMEGHVPIPEFTEDVATMLTWCLGGATVVVRNKLTGHSGDGIVLIEKGQVNTLSEAMNYEAPLYTRYIYKVKEYRVHVVAGKVIDTQQKIKDPNQDVKTWKVRSHANGFIFARNNIVQDPSRDFIAMLAVKHLGLDFGAVDIIQDKSGKYFVLEVNTAPGLEGQTVTSYAKAFKEAYGT